MTMSISRKPTVNANSVEPVPGELLFYSGFDGTTRLAPAKGPYFHGPREQYQDIVGAESDRPDSSAWEELSRHPNLGDLRIYYEGGTATQRLASIVPDDADPTNRVLRFWLGEPNVTIHWPNGPEHKARVQAELYGNTDLREIYQTVRLRLHPDFQLLHHYPQKIGWLTLFEFWNQPFWDHPYPFRISITVSKPTAGVSDGLYFSADAQTMVAPQTFVTQWSRHPQDFKIPYGQWLDMAIYYREGDKENGRLFMAVTPQGGTRHVIFDVHDCTHHPANPSPGGLTHYNPMKIYTSAEVVDFVRKQGHALQIDWDNLSLWKGRAPAQAKP